MEKWKKPELVKFSWPGSKRVAENKCGEGRAQVGLKHLPQILYSQDVIFKSDSTYGNVARLFEENLSRDLRPTSWDTRSCLSFSQFSMVSSIVPSQDVLSPFTFLMIHMPEDAAVERAVKSSGKGDLDLDEHYAAQRAKRRGLQRTFQSRRTQIPAYIRGPSDQHADITRR